MSSMGHKIILCVNEHGRVIISLFRGQIVFTSSVQAVSTGRKAEMCCLLQVPGEGCSQRMPHTDGDCLGISSVDSGPNPWGCFLASAVLK